jgi:hypothetical protein
MVLNLRDCLAKSALNASPERTSTSSKPETSVDFVFFVD